MILTEENKYSWLRQNKEPENSFKWFTYYRDMEGTRRLKKVIEVMKQKEPYLETFPTYQQIRKASSIWHWKQRSIDYDNYLQIQLIESHKKTLISYEEESINIDKTLYKALNNEIQKLIKNNEIDPLKKIKAFKEAQEVNKALLSNIEHIANTELPTVKYIDLEATRQQDIIQTLINNTEGTIAPEEAESVTDGFTPEEVEDVINREINKITVRNKGLGNILTNMGVDSSKTIKFNNKSFNLNY